MRYDSIDMIGIINCYHVRVKDNLFLRLIMRRGRPTKKIKRNISGLKNQDVLSIASHDSSPGSTSPAPGPGVRPQPIVPDSTGIDWEEDDVAPMDSDLDDQMELDIWDDEDQGVTHQENIKKTYSRLQKGWHCQIRKVNK